MRFFAFTGEGKSGETFTLNPLYHSFLSPKGEKVKAKSRKQRTRALRARVGVSLSDVSVGRAHCFAVVSRRRSFAPICHPASRKGSIGSVWQKIEAQEGFHLLFDSIIVAIFVT